MKQTLFIVLVTIFSINMNAQSSSNIKKQPKEQLNKKNILKIYINSKADLLLDEKKASFKKLEKELKKLQKKNGTVYFSRVFKGKETDEMNTKIISVLKKYQVAVVFFTDNTFSEVADW